MSIRIKILIRTDLHFFTLANHMDYNPNPHRFHFPFTLPTFTLTLLYYSLPNLTFPSLLTIWIIIQTQIVFTLTLPTLRAYGL